VKSTVFFSVVRRRPDWGWTNHPNDALAWAVFGAVWSAVGAALGFLVLG
jgi:hypothetical protein